MDMWPKQECQTSREALTVVEHAMLAKPGESGERPDWLEIDGEEMKAFLVAMIVTGSQ